MTEAELALPSNTTVGDLKEKLGVRDLLISDRNWVQIIEQDLAFGEIRNCEYSDLLIDGARYITFQKHPLPNEDIAMAVSTLEGALELDVMN